MQNRCLTCCCYAVGKHGEFPATFRGSLACTPLHSLLLLLQTKWPGERRRVPRVKKVSIKTG